MARTLVDEPPPTTQNEPPTGDRMTLDDVPGASRPTMDDIPAYVAPGERRGPSPTLVDPPATAPDPHAPPQPAPPRRGASPTLADGPPRVNRTSVAAPLHVQPATPRPAPIAAPGPTAVVDSAVALARPAVAPAPPAAPAQPPAANAAAPSPFVITAESPGAQPFHAAAAQSPAPGASVPVILPPPSAVAPAAAPAQGNTPLAALPAPAQSLPAPAQSLPAPAVSPLAPTALPVPPAPAALPVPPAPPLPAAPAVAAPVASAPPPLAYPGASSGAGLLAKLPAMPANRPAMSPFPPQVGLIPVAAGPHPTPAHERIAVPPPVAAPVPFAGPAPVAAPAVPLDAPVLREHPPSPEPIHTTGAPETSSQLAPSPQAGAQQAPSPLAPYPQAAAQQAPSPLAPYPQAAARQAPSPLAPSPQAAARQAPSPLAPSPQAGAPRVAAGGRTLVGVAPPPGPPGGAAQAAFRPIDTGAPYSPPGQTSAPDPLSATLPVTPSVIKPVAPGGPEGGAGPEAGSSPGQPSGDSSSANSASPGGDPSFTDNPSPSDTSQPAARPGPRKSRAGAVIAAVIAVLGVLAIVGVVAAYLVFFRYTPLAERHIPAASNVAVRADLRQIGTFAPVRKHLWPAFEKPSLKTEGKTLADKIAEGTGIRPTTDLREVILASVDSRSWVALVGGNLEPGTFVAGLEKVLKEEGYPGWQRSGELLVGPAGVAVGQADDGTIVLGTEAEIVKAALPSSEEHKRMALPTGSAVSFAITKEAWEELSRSAGAFDAGGSLRRVRHVMGTLSLGDEPAVDIDVEPKGGENADNLAKDVETMLAALRLGLLLFPDQMGEKTALSSAKVTVEDARIHVRGPWPLEGLDRACEKLAGIAGLK